MRPLESVLADFDLGHLRIIAELWGLELGGGGVKAARAELIAAMLSPAAAELREGLPAESQAALDFLLASPEGRLPLAAFARQFGEIRAMGPARRDREQPWRAPISPAEPLWYRGLIGRAFDNSPQGPQEFVFVPTDLRAWLPAPAPASEPSPGTALRLGESARVAPGTTAIVDDACTLLAALQRRPTAAPKAPGALFSEAARAELLPFLIQPQTLDLTHQLLLELGVIAAPAARPDPGHARPFLEASRAEQLIALARAYRESSEWNDLFHVPGLQPEGTGWRNDPVVARGEILSLLNRVPRGEWWSLESFIASVKALRPDFQRPAGDYESWYIRDVPTGDYLRGFEHWERVDGGLIRYLITGPLHWLGAIDLASEGSEGAPLAFRLSRFCAAVLDRGKSPELPLPERPERVRVHSDGRIGAPRTTSRYERFQVARFSDWASRNEAGYEYRLSPASLSLAARQAIQVRHVLAFLRKAAEPPLPPSVEKALADFEAGGAAGRVQTLTVLKVRSPEILARLGEAPTTRRYLGEALGELAVEVRRADWFKLVAAAAELGILLDVESGG